MRYLPNGAWMQKADAYTIQEIGIPSIVLMEHAAIKTVEVMEQCGIDTSASLIVCGSGNNGGDGFAVARLLWQKGKKVMVLFVGREGAMSEECKVQARAAKNLGIPIVTAFPGETFTVVIDAIFGVGLNREVRGNYVELIEKLNVLDGAKVAVDIPSGIHSETGQVLGIAFRADVTVSFQCEKLGTVFFPGKEYAGNVVVPSIGILTSGYEKQKDICYTLEKNDIGKMLPKRKANSHKGTYGKVLMITGGAGMAGAAYLSAKAAYIAGAGLVRIYTPEVNRAILQQLLPEAVLSTYQTYNEHSLAEALEWADVVCMGCGLGQSQVSEAMVEYVMNNCQVPCVIDADGLNLLSCRIDLLKKAEFPIIITPHMKEMSGLTGNSVGELQKNRMSVLKTFTKEYPVICVLKDARTVVYSEEKHPFVNTAGNQAMAKAGSGDVLAGTITGLLGGHMAPYEAAILGVYLHACGGDLAKEAQGSYSVLAEDLIREIGNCMKKAEEER